VDQLPKERLGLEAGVAGVPPLRPGRPLAFNHVGKGQAAGPPQAPGLELAQAITDRAARRQRPAEQPPRLLAAPRQGRDARELLVGVLGAVSDPELLSLKDEAVLLTARQLELAADLVKTQGPPWQAAVEALNDLVTARRADKAEKLARLSQIIRSGAEAATAYSSTWASLREVIQERTRVVTAESKRFAELGATVRAEDMMGVLVGLLEAVHQNVTDAKARNAIQNRFNQLLEAKRNGAPDG
jgi:hypothetical protein